MPGPYRFVEQENTVEVVRHNNEGIQDEIRKVNRYCIPARNHDVPCLAPYHGALYDLAEETLVVSGANGYEIRSLLGIVESR